MSNLVELPDQSTLRARLAAEIRAEMGRANVRQRGLAAITGISQATLSRKLKAHDEGDSFNVSELERISRALGISLSKLFAAAEDYRPDGGASAAQPGG